MKRLLIGLLFIAAASLLWWMVWNQFEASGQPSEEKITETTPEFIINDFESLQFNLEGKLESHINATELVKFSKSDESKLKNPVIKYIQYQEDGNWQWNIVADRGDLREKKKIIKLFGKVVVKRKQLDGESNEAFQLDTEALFLNLEGNSFSSNTHVVIKTNFGQISSKGISGSMESGKIFLKENVEGSYLTGRIQQ